MCLMDSKPKVRTIAADYKISQESGGRKGMVQWAISASSRTDEGANRQLGEFYYCFDGLGIMQRNSKVSPNGFLNWCRSPGRTKRL